VLPTPAKCCLLDESKTHVAGQKNLAANRFLISNGLNFLLFIISDLDAKYGEYVNLARLLYEKLKIKKARFLYSAADFFGPLRFL
jgi:hypothetical protein